MNYIQNYLELILFKLLQLLINLNLKNLLSTC